VQQQLFFPGRYGVSRDNHCRSPIWTAAER
jgi:hypothetical protein